MSIDMLVFGTCVAWACVLGFALAFRQAARATQLLGMSTALGIALGLFTFLRFGGPELDAGRRLFDGGLMQDHFAVWVDGLIALLAGLSSLSIRRHRGERSLLDACALWLGAAGASLAVHATGLLMLLTGLEVAAMAAWVSASDGARVEGRAPWLFVLCSLLGVALIFGGGAQLDLAGTGARVAKVFNQWNGSMRYHHTLLEKGDVLPSGFVAQAEGKVISGMAPASLVLPGVLFVSLAVFGRLFAGGPLASPRWAFVRLAAWVVLVRFFVAVLHAPRMVNEPYGWVGPLGLLAMLWMGLGAWESRRARTLDELDAAGARANLGLLVFSCVLAANYFGHRVMADGPFAATLEVSWSQRAGDDAIIAALTLVSAAFVSSALLQAWRAGSQYDSLAQLRGLRDRDGLAAWSLVGVLWSSSFVPGSIAFFVLLAAMRSVMEHSSLRLFLPWVVLCVVVVAWNTLALAARIIWEDAGEESAEAPRVRTSGGVLAFALVLAALGLQPQWLLERTRVAGAGLSRMVGSEDRAKWLDQSRRRWRGEKRLEGLDVELLEPEKKP